MGLSPADRTKAEQSWLSPSDHMHLLGAGKRRVWGSRSEQGTLRPPPGTKLMLLPPSEWPRSKWFSELAAQWIHQGMLKTGLYTNNVQNTN